MTENTSWLKKSAPMPSLRAVKLNLPDNNSTLTIQNGDGDPVTKFPKRKSYMMFKPRKSVIVTSAKKTRLDTSRAPNSAGFRNRTLKMVEGRASLMPQKQPDRPSLMPQRQADRQSLMPRLQPTRRTQIASRHFPPKTQSTPLHMSTPCDVPRSILRPTRVQQQKPLSAKKVIFDSATTEDGVAPLEESTIPDFNNFDLKNTVTKVDVSTNTEEIIQKEDNPMFELLKEVSKKLDQLLERSDCCCQTPLPRTNGVKSFAVFMNKLDNIQEVSENVTPSTQEANSTKDSTDTPKLKSIDSKQDHDPVVQDLFPNNADLQAKEFEESASSSPAIDNNIRRSARLQGTNHVDSPQPIVGKLRKFRKRAIPRYLESFELSPKGKIKKDNSKQ